jgi:ribosome biogenesis GTPase A
MTTSEIKSMLERYNENVATVRVNITEIESLRIQLQYNQTRCNQTQAEAIEEIVFAGKEISDMPRSPNNTFRSSTELAVMGYRRSSKNDFDIEKIKSRLNYLEAYIEPYMVEIDIIDSGITRLGEKEKFVINEHYMKDYNLVEVMEKFVKCFQFATYKTIYRIRDQAIERIAVISERRG